LEMPKDAARADSEICRPRPRVPSTMASRIRATATSVRDRGISSEGAMPISAPFRD